MTATTLVTTARSDNDPVSSSSQSITRLRSITSAFTGATPSTSLVQTIPSAALPHVSGVSSQLLSFQHLADPLQSVHSTLDMQGTTSAWPWNTAIIPTPSSSMIPNATTSVEVPQSTHQQSLPLEGNNIFQPVAHAAPPNQIQRQYDHPVPRTGIQSSGPIETNKFYANFFLGERTGPTFTHPYSISWVAGQGATGSWGIAISHVSRSQTDFGPGQLPSYYANPVGLQSIIISARQLEDGTSLSATNLNGFSCHINLAPSSQASPLVTFPIIQGMGMTTAIFHSATPQLQSSIGFRALKNDGNIEGSNTVRYTTTLMDDTTWYIYLTPSDGAPVPILMLLSPFEMIGNGLINGIIQVAKNPDTVSMNSAQGLYDKSAGAYAVSGMVTASTSGSEATYSLSWTKAGSISKTLLMWALPHHVESFSPNTSALLQNVVLQTTTKGLASAILADHWTMQEILPTTMEFAPWDPETGSHTSLPEEAASLVADVASMELGEDIETQTNVNSMYYAGKALAKFATIVYTARDLAKAPALAFAGLPLLKEQFSRFVNNTQSFPLIYESAWGGIVSSASYSTGDPNIDFGNSYYNDHHFHYGYFVYTAAVIGYLDPHWLEEGTNKDWVQSLVRDYANSVSNDNYFPFSRMFDWYHGHSWASGLFESVDGKNQESSSEDAFASYAMKMWGRTIGDANMEARGNLMLAVQSRALNNYYLMQDTNTVQPSRFVPNKAAGILFENKVDHTTYFGTNIEFIEGIHMLPLNPSSTLTRKKAFVREEWDMYFGDGRADSIQSGWKGILYANLAIIDPVTAYNWFAQPDFPYRWLDGGASRTWYLALSAGLGGAS